MRRRITEEFMAWKGSSARKPLLVLGARQVGKTYSLRGFGDSAFGNVAYVDFSRDVSAASIFEGSIEPRAIVAQLSELTRTPISSDTLIVLDEVQLCDRALTSLKYFQQDAPELHVAAAGSLLGVKVNRQDHSFPVGKVDIVSMRPLDFEEYLWARGNAGLADMIRSSLAADERLGLHDMAIDIMREYLLVGGMPEAVAAFLAKREDDAYGALEGARAVQAAIGQGYVADMTKYASAAESVRIYEAWRSVPDQLAKENRKFQYKQVASGGRASRYEAALAWLEAAGVVSRCTQVSDGAAPLRAFEKAEAFKLYLADTGLLASLYGAEMHDVIPADDKGARFRGGLAENYCMQQFVAGGCTPRYWGTASRSEVEFVMRTRGGDVVPVEVKSGVRVRSNSLQAYRAKYEPPYVVRVSARNFGREGGVRSVPLYAARFLAEEFAAG